MLLNYGEGEKKAFSRLNKEIENRVRGKHSFMKLNTVFYIRVMLA
jgi:hypothetical protein